MHLGRFQYTIVRTLSVKQDCPPWGPLSDFAVKSSFSSSLNPAALNVIQTAS